MKTRLTILLTLLSCCSLFGQLTDAQLIAQDSITIRNKNPDPLRSFNMHKAIIQNKVNNNITVNGHALNANVSVTKSDVGLDNVDNTSDVDKPVSTAQQAALDLKSDALTSGVGTTAVGTSINLGGNVSSNATLTLNNSRTLSIGGLKFVKDAGGVQSISTTNNSFNSMNFIAGNLGAGTNGSSLQMADNLLLNNLTLTNAVASGGYNSTNTITYLNNLVIDQSIVPSVLNTPTVGGFSFSKGMNLATSIAPGYGIDFRYKLLSNTNISKDVGEDTHEYSVVTNGSESATFTKKIIKSGSLSNAYSIKANSNMEFAVYGPFLPAIFASDPVSLTNGYLWYNSTSNSLKSRINGSTVSLSGNSAAVNEFAKSDGANLVGTKLFGTAPESITWGDASVANAARTLTLDATGSTASLIVQAKGAGSLALYTTSGSMGVYGNDLCGLNVVQDGSGTNNSTTARTIRKITSSTATTGFGVNDKIELENSTGGLPSAAIWDYTWDDATNTSEDTRVTLKGLIAGSSVELLKSSGGNLTTYGDLNLGNSTTAGPIRTISPNGSTSDVGLYITPKGNGAISFTNFAGAISTPLLIDPSLGVRISTAAATENKITTGNTNIVQYPIRLIHESTGTPANGIGTGLQFSTETSVGVNKVGATVEAVTTDVTSSSEDFDIIFKTMVSGASVAEQFRISSNGLKIATAPTVDNTINKILSIDGSGIVKSVNLLDAISLTTSGSTITLDLNSQKERAYSGSTSFATAKVIAFSNATNAIDFSTSFTITNVAAVLTMPSSVIMQTSDTRWSSGAKTWTPAATGAYQMNGKWDTILNEWFVTISQPYN